MSESEIKARYRIYKLGENERIESFDRGDEDLNDFILNDSVSMKGMSIGSMLLDFIKNYFVADNKTGCRFITVDAYSEAIPFYLKNGFVPLNEEDMEEPTRLLYFDLNDLDDY